MGDEISVVSLHNDELRCLADLVTGGEVLATEIRNRWFPRWLVRLLLGENAIYQMDRIENIAQSHSFSTGLVKLLRDYEP